MKAETRFPRTVEAYKAHLHEDRPHYDSFQTFCRKQGVRIIGKTKSTNFQNEKYKK